VLASIGDFMVANAVLPAAQGSTCKNLKKNSEM
jgi:hypothetical protein